MGKSKIFTEHLYRKPKTTTKINQILNFFSTNKLKNLHFVISFGWKNDSQFIVHLIKSTWASLFILYLKRTLEPSDIKYNRHQFLHSMVRIHYSKSSTKSTQIITKLGFYMEIINVTEMDLPKLKCGKSVKRNNQRPNTFRDVTDFTNDTNLQKV